MKNEIKQNIEPKKLYVVPQMEILEFEQQHVLSCSDCDDDNVNAGFYGK